MPAFSPDLLRTFSRCLLGFLCGLLLTLAPAAAGVAGWERVRYVNDGDTIVLENAARVRYLGINTPEIGDAREPSEPFAQAARRFNTRLVLHQKVRLEFDRQRQDRYGRQLAYVFLADGTMVNELLVREGFAYCLYRSPNDRYLQRLLDRQREALRAGRGIWRVLPEQKGLRYLGNTRSRRFHRTGCALGEATGRGQRVLFESLRDAFWEGFAPGRCCFPRGLTP
jgi:micrococcal nuclease